MKSEEARAIDILVADAHGNAREKGFWDDIDLTEPRVTLGLLMLITTEVAEAAEAVRRDDDANFAEELADICIRVFDVAGGLGVSLGEEIERKMEANAERPRKHGKVC